MSLSEIQPKRTAHTLFMDFVGYSRLSADSQAAVQVTLQNLVYNLPAFQAARGAGQLMVRKTGDGMAIVFFEDIEFPLAAAVALDEVIKHQTANLREQVGANFRLRMGIHSGPVVIIDEDGDGIMDVAGEGINIAQRVMDCGEQGHILVSAAVANAVSEREHWKVLLNDLGIVRVKHDELVHLYSLHGVRPDGTRIGFEAVPRKVNEARERARELAEQETSREKIETRATLTNYALRAALLTAAFVAVGALLLALWRNSTLNTKEVAHVADVIRQNRLEKENKNKVAPPVTLTTPSPTAPNTNTEGLVHADVPNVVGQLRPDAEKALSSVGLKLLLSAQTPEVENVNVPPGSVVNQSPPPGQQSVKDGVVYVTLARAAVAPPPVPNEPQTAFTGVLVDARAFTQLAEAQTIGLFGPNDSPLYSATGVTNDEVQAIQQVGINPLRISASVAGASAVGVSAEDVAKLRLLPDAIRAKTVVLRP